MDKVFTPKLPADTDAMALNLRLMEWTGLWGPRTGFYRFVVGYSYGVMIILFPKIVFGMGSDRFDVIAKGTGELFFIGNLHVAMAFFAMKRQPLEQFVYILRSVIREVTAEGQSEEQGEIIREQHMKCNKFTKLFGIGLGTAPFVFCVPAIATSYWRYFTASGNESEPVQFELPMEQGFYGLQIRTNFGHYHIFVVLAILAYLYGCFIAVIKTATMLIMIRFNSTVYRLVAARVRNFTKIEGNAGKFDELKKLVNLHRKAIEMTELVEDVINIPMAMQFLTSIMYWCLVMFYSSVNMNISLVNVLVPCMCSLVETYGFSYLGSELTDEAADIGAAIYELPWYDHSLEFQKYYRFILMRAQRLTGISAAKFFIVGFKQFGSVMNLSYSYYLVLKDAFV